MGHPDVLRGGAGVRHLEDDIVNDETVVNRRWQTVGQLRGEEGDLFAAACILFKPDGDGMYGVECLIADIYGVDGDKCL